MIRRPPRSTLFPTRRSSDLRPVDLREPDAGQYDPVPRRCRIRVEQTLEHGRLVVDRDRAVARDGAARRSEEHTSELQSPCNLVCRLLLEKKQSVTVNTLSHY